MGNNGSSIARPQLTNFLEKISSIIPGGGKIANAIETWINKQARRISEWFGDEEISFSYLAMLQELNEMLSSKNKVLMNMATDIVKIVKDKESNVSLNEAAGKIMSTDNDIFKGKSEFGHDKVENLVNYFLKKKVHNHKLADAEGLLVRIQTEVKENGNMLKSMKKYINGKNIIALYGCVLELINNGEDFKEIISDAKKKGFKSLQVMYDFDYAESLLQGGMSLSIDALQYFFDSGDFSGFEGAIASFHTAIGTSITYEADGFSFALNTKGPEDVDGFGISIGADPDASGPAKEISVACPMGWDSEGIIPNQYSIGVTDDYVLPTGLDACVIIYEIKAKELSGFEAKAWNRKMFRNPIKKLKLKNRLEKIHEKVKDRVEDMREKVEDRYEDIREEVKEHVEDAKEIIGDIKDSIEDVIQDGKDALQDFIDSSIEKGLHTIIAIPAIPSPAMAKLSGNPSLYYAQMEWDELDTENWEILGWNEGMWERQRVRPKSVDTPMSDLSPEEQEAAKDLGFTAKTWDAPTCMEAWRTEDPNAFYHYYKWDQMLNYERGLWEILGWDENKWNGVEKNPASYRTKWDSLTDAEMVAAMKLGYNEERWYMSSTYFKSNWYAFKSKVSFVDANKGKWYARFRGSDWRFGRAEVRLYDENPKTSEKPKEIKNFTDVNEYKRFVLPYCEAKSNTAALMKSELRPIGNEGVMYWEDYFQSFSPGLDGFKDVPEGVSLDGFAESSFPSGKSKI